MPKLKLTPHALTAALVALAACSAQQDTSYPGEPLAVLGGTVTTSGTAQPPPLDLVLFWEPAGETGSVGSNVSATTPIAVEGQFPSTFTLDLLTPPPGDVLGPCTNLGFSNDDEPEVGHFGFAHLDAVLQGADAGVFADYYGEAFEFRVVYVDQDIVACDFLSQYVLPPLSKGYHLLQRIAGLCPAANQTAFGCAPFAEVPFSTSIQLSILADPMQFGPFDVHPINGLGAGPNCLNANSSLPTDPTLGSPCDFFIASTSNIAPPFDCAAPGRTAATPLQCAELFDDTQQPPDVCELAQIPPSAWVNGSCAQSTQPGWCYVSGPAAEACAQGAIVFSSSAAPPPSTFGQLICP